MNCRQITIWERCHLQQDSEDQDIEVEETILIEHQLDHVWVTPFDTFRMCRILDFQNVDFQKV